MGKAFLLVVAVVALGVPQAGCVSRGIDLQAVGDPTPMPTYDAPCVQQDNDVRCDLEAQWKAADAARDAADWNWWQMVLGALGFGGLLYSLNLNRRATNAAVAANADTERALKSADRTADAAQRQAQASEEALAMQREFSEKELRAYVTVKFVKALTLSTGSSKEASVQVEYHNIGNTPALHVRVILASISPTYFNGIILSLNDTINGLAPLTIMPGGTSSILSKGYPHNVVGHFDLDPNFVGAWEGGSGYLIAEGLIEYEDVFGKKRETRFRYVLDGRSGPSVMQFFPASSGNSMT